MLPLLGLLVLCSWLLLCAVQYFENKKATPEVPDELQKLIRIFSILIGAMWMGEILFGNLGDTPLFGSLPTAHPQLYRTLGSAFIIGAVAFTMLAGFAAAVKLGRMSKALLVTVCSGFFSGAIALATILAMEVVFRSALLQSPSVLHEFAGSGQTSVTQFMFLDALAGGLNHLWIGPLLGITAGLIGAGLGILDRRTPAAAM